MCVCVCVCVHAGIGVCMCVCACHRESVKGQHGGGRSLQTTVSSAGHGIPSQNMVQGLLYILIPMVDFSWGIK